MYIINLNFSMHNMLMCNIISKVLEFLDLRWYILQAFKYIYLYNIRDDIIQIYIRMYVEYYLKYNILYVIRLYMTTYYD
jgi:hypothetical protein